MSDSVSVLEISKEQPNFVQTTMVQDVINRSLAYLGAGFPVHLTGPAGTGKTCLALFIAAQIGRPIIIMHGDEELGTSNMVGGNFGLQQRKVVDNFVHSVRKLDHRVESIWVDNRLTEACKFGHTLVYDEFTRSRPEANNALLSVLEEGVLDIPARRGEESFVRVHPNFRALFTSNPTEYAGVHRAADALQDRMITIKLGYYDRDTELAITMAKSGIDRDSAKRIVDIVREFREFHEANREAHEICPTVRASVMIATILKAYRKRPKPGDESFLRLCYDVLDSSRWTGSSSCAVRTKVDALVRKHVA